jgi:hypothetical protein
VGAVGFSVDEVEKTLRIFELISLSERPVRFLLSEMLRTCIPLWGIEYLEVDVSAYAPRMQRTLLELGFLPAAYIPAMVFHEVERLDGIRMVRILLKPEHGGMDLLPESQAIANLVLRGFIDRQVIPKIAKAVPQIPLFAGMNDEQIRQVARRCTLKTFQPGEQIIRENEAGQETFIVLEGEASISTGQSATHVGTVGASECLGEMSYLAHARHSATATSQTKTETAILLHRELDNLIRLRPDIGVIIYRNLATGLGKKLIRSDKR